jgi:hypothetical protein
MSGTFVSSPDATGTLTLGTETLLVGQQLPWMEIRHLVLIPMKLD